MKKYTIGEVFRLGLLKNYQGKPYKHKATISKLINLLNYDIIETAYGPAKVVSKEEIERSNNSRKLNK